MLQYSISFYIRKARGNQNKKSPIYLRLKIDDRKLELSTGQSVMPGFWNPKKEKVVKSHEAVIVNYLLDQHRLKIIDAMHQLYFSGAILSTDSIRRVLEGEKVTKSYTLLELTEEHNKDFYNKTGVVYSMGSYKNYKTTYSFLKEFIPRQYSQPDILLSSVDNKFCEHYFTWLTTKKTCNVNGAAKHIQRLKKLLNYAVKYGYTDKNPIANHTVKTQPVVREALTWEEIAAIETLVLHHHRLASIRDIFVFQIYTGLAYAEVKALCTKHLWTDINGKLWLKMQRSKTKNTFSVPLLPKALELLNKYQVGIEGKEQPIFPVITNQKMNYNLKIIQELAGISKPLHTHLPRHTFATTITLMNGVPIETVSKMLGHSKLAMTQVYAKVGELKIGYDMDLLEQKLGSAVVRR